MRDFGRLFWGIGAATIWLAASSALGAEEKPAATAKPEAAQAPAGSAPAGAEAVFEMREVSVFSLPRDAGPFSSMLVRGHPVECKTEPDKEVKAYPKLKSKRPFYGSVVFDRDTLHKGPGIKFHFVIDESGEAQSGAGAQEGTSALLKGLAAAMMGAGRTPAKETAPTVKTKPATYDRLYFDLDRNLDLTNDRVLKPKAPPPGAVSAAPPGSQEATFDFLDVPFDYGPGVGVRPFRVLPRLMVMEDQRAMFLLVATVARQGDIQIGSRRYGAVMGQSFGITGRFDRPFTGLFLTSLDGQTDRYGGLTDAMLCAFRRDGEKYYTTSATPLGDKLTVRLYQGDMGVLAVGSGGRKIDKCGVLGSLLSRDSAVAIGDAMRYLPEHKVPVGDYLPEMLSIEFGRLQISVSNNYHSDGRPRDPERAHHFGIQIRKDKPFVLDFSNKPVVMFASPGKDQTLKPGDELRVAAVLTDPKLDVMIRRLNDTGRTQKETIKSGDREQTIERQVSLDPIVTITDSAGKKVAEGVMPFG